MESRKLYVGNLKYSVTEEQLEELFSKYGDVKSARIIHQKGFGFVEYSTLEEAENAKEALNGKEYEGRTMRVDDARPVTPHQRREY
ncbi:RNA-binding protein [Methanoplanus sp. FWC-SCC4]|uniref:RNA-binding protein n=1 Tax=Methanochimaera problematica TaxID=2609417 RepID=A0AA97FFZ5_9EURY|nr:RNA-binding protein [Methanoplanus sp. FWC-SCC4]WOF16761.1 RNA-binding protein [Methanoplanus sp. FWC-SCC4]